jgi:hypothetical protein
MEADAITANSATPYSFAMQFSRQRDVRARINYFINTLVDVIQQGGSEYNLNVALQVRPQLRIRLIILLCVKHVL